MRRSAASRSLTTTPVVIPCQAEIAWACETLADGVGDMVVTEAAEAAAAAVAAEGGGGGGGWLGAAGKLAEEADKRSRTFDDPSFLLRAVNTVEKYATAAASDTSTPASTSINGTDQDQDPAFDAPTPQASPEAARALGRLFTVLRNSCAGCPANNKALRHTGLAEAALRFAIDQAPFACGAELPHPAPTENNRCSSGNSIVRIDGSNAGGSSATATAAKVTRQEEAAAAAAAVGGDTAGVKFAVRAGLQFACNFCVGIEDNKALLWDAWFPRGLMELANGLKTDRGLLSLAVALVHNCCLSSPPQSQPQPRERGDDCGGSDRGSQRKNGARGGEGRQEVEKEERQEDEGRQRLGRLVADRAFCCLLMKAVVPQTSAGGGAGGGDSSTTTSAPSAGRGSGVNPNPDPAAEWLYLLFCRFVEGRLCRDVYENVGIRTGGGQRRQRQRQHQSIEGVVCSGAEEGGDGAVEAGSSTTSSTSTSTSTNSYRVSSSGQGGGEEEKEEGREAGRGQEEEDDFFFPVTPEQLIALNLAELAAGDEVVTGGERPDSQQSQACEALVAWLVGLLSAMPLNQRLLPQIYTATAAAVAAAVAEDGVDGEVVDWQTERVRWRMREEARSSVLRTLAALLAGCGDETRRTAATWTTTPVSTPDIPTAAAAAPGEAGAEVAAAAAASSGVSNGNCTGAECAVQAVPHNSEDAIGACDAAPPRPPKIMTTVPVGAPPETRLVPLCLRLLRGCGGAAEPKSAVKPSSSAGASGRGGSTTATAVVATAAAAAARETDNLAGEGVRGAVTADAAGVPGDVPAGRKVELLKVIGNACFRCRDAQDSVREEGGLPLVLNHCAMDEANPFLREHALLTVRNLCEGNPANQASIAALQPQGCTPGMDEALADMGLEGHVDGEGGFKVGPRPAAATPPPPSPSGL